MNRINFIRLNLKELLHFSQAQATQSFAKDPDQQHPYDNDKDRSSIEAEPAQRNQERGCCSRRVRSVQEQTNDDRQSDRQRRRELATFIWQLLNDSLHCTTTMVPTVLGESLGWLK